jgi:hypothetical protein
MSADSFQGTAATFARLHSCRFLSLGTLQNPLAYSASIEIKEVLYQRIFYAFLTIRNRPCSLKRVQP